MSVQPHLFHGLHPRTSPADARSRGFCLLLDSAALAANGSLHHPRKSALIEAMYTLHEHDHV